VDLIYLIMYCCSTATLKFVSKLLAADYSVSNDTVYVTGEGKVVFSNGTLLSHDGGTYQYIVKNSNGIDRFQLYTIATTSSPSVLFANPSGVLRRNVTE
jgi:hypothetical protein